MPSATDEFEQNFKPGTKIHQVYLVLRDQQWHCRECQYTHIGITQIAGGSGIQGLERGTGSRRGMIIESANHYCGDCRRTTRHDRWQGAFQSAVHGGSIPGAFVDAAMRVFRRRDVVEKTLRQYDELTVDHKLPTIRWNEESKAKLTDYSNLDPACIKANFQLLKKSNGSVSHNLLKSRACERCVKTGKRGKPFDINCFYAGGPNWAPSDEKDASGCIGCGWYDFDLWRKSLNKRLRRSL